MGKETVVHMQNGILLNREKKGIQPYETRMTLVDMWNKLHKERQLLALVVTCM